MLVKEIKEVKRGRIKEYLNYVPTAKYLKDVEVYGILNVI